MRASPRCRFAGAMLLVAAVPAGCQQAAGPGAPATVIAVPDSLRLTPGSTARLVAVVVDASARPIADAATTFLTSNASIATVSAAGLVQSTGPAGSASIIVQAAGAVADTVPVTVAAAAAQLQVSPTDTTVPRGRSYQLLVTVRDSGGVVLSGAPVVFSAATPAFAQVSAAGVVTATGGPGVATIRVTSGGLVAFVLVRLIDARALGVAPADTTIGIGRSYQLRASVLDTVTGDTVPGAAFTYQAVDPSVISVSASGLVQSVGPAGQSLITVRSGALQQSATVQVVDTSIVARTPLSGAPFGMAESAQGVVYVTRVFANSIARIDPPGTAVTLSFPTGGVPTSTAFDVAGGKAFVTNQGSQSVGVITVATNQMTTTLPVTGDPFVVRVSPDGQTAWVTTTASLLLGFDVATGARTDSFPTGAIGNGIAFHPTNDSLVYMSDIGGGLTEVNVTTSTILRRIALGGAAQGVAISPGGQEAYVANEGLGQLQVVNLSSGVITGVPVGGAPFDLQLSADSSQIWIGLQGGQVRVLDRASRAIVRTITTGGQPRRMAFSPSRNLWVVANEAGWIDFLR